MKKVLLFSCLLCILTAFQATAQAGQAVLTKSGAVLLNDQQPLQEHYTLDASLFNFESDQQAIDYFKVINSNNVVYRPTLYNGKVNIYLQLKKQPTWTLSDWNAYLAEHKAQPTETNHETSK